MKTEQTFTEVFRQRVEKIEADAKEVGLNFTSICKEAGISRATPDRWKRSTPKTVKLIQMIEDIIEARKAEIGAGQK
jgi:hypothetical protein